MAKLLETLSRRWQSIQGNLFPWLEEELGPLTDVHRKVVTILDVVRIEQYVHSGLYGDPGRPPAMMRDQLFSEKPIIISRDSLA